jgi:enhancer of polycomb-like protein
LQQAIVGQSKSKNDQVFIPTPDALPSSLKYETVYKKRFALPTTYIRFSSTVEDTSGAAYCLTEEDEEFLKTINTKRPATSHINERQFEEVMQFFETTAMVKQPYAAVDHPPVLELEELQTALEWDEVLQEDSKQYLGEVYPHWKEERTKFDNKSIMPSIKVRVFETGQDPEDNDPYVCFRRRESRQIRKTRGRDAQSTEKLRRLRKDLEDARSLLKMVNDREKLKMEVLKTDRRVFGQRLEVKNLKRKLGLKDSDEDLINHKPPKKKAVEVVVGQRPQTALRLPGRVEGRSSDDLVTLEEFYASREAEKRHKIEEKIMQHKAWNRGFLDITKYPLSPPSEQVNSNFRTATTQYLPTPPASISSDQSAEDEKEKIEDQTSKYSVHYASPSPDLQSQPCFRRRIGRGGRVLIDRRLPLAKNVHVDPIVADRFKYDHDDDDDEQQVYYVDPYDSLHLRYRASLIPIHPFRGQMTPEQAALAHAQAQAKAAALKAVAAQSQAALPSAAAGLAATPPTVAAVPVAAR